MKKNMNIVYEVSLYRSAKLNKREMLYILRFGVMEIMVYSESAYHWTLAGNEQ